jgi:hypothetical protein
MKNFFELMDFKGPLTPTSHVSVAATFWKVYKTSTIVFCKATVEKHS